MSILAPNLRAISKRLDLSDADVARKAGLSERRYGFYATGKREPDLKTLVRIAKVLGVTPNELLGWSKDDGRPPKSAIMRQRLAVAADTLADPELELVLVQVEALASRGRRPKPAKRKK